LKKKIMNIIMKVKKVWPYVCKAENVIIQLTLLCLSVWVIWWSASTTTSLVISKLKHEENIHREITKCILLCKLLLSPTFV
jgi:hypothetical protein